MPPSPRLVLEDVVPRLKKAAADVDDARGVYELALQRRDRLIVHAVDQGTAQRAVIEASGLSKGRVIAILAASEHDAEPAVV